MYPQGLNIKLEGVGRWVLGATPPHTPYKVNLEDQSTAPGRQKPHDVTSHHSTLPTMSFIILVKLFMFPLLATVCIPPVHTQIRWMFSQPWTSPPTLHTSLVLWGYRMD